MAITNGYASLEEIKRWVDTTSVDAPDDAVLENIITSVSRYIDRGTWRRFYASTETRYYTAVRGDMLVVDDLLDITGVTGWIKTDSDGDRTYEDTWATTDYDLLPLNASLDSEPYTLIEITPNGDYRFPIINKGVEIKASFGFSATTPPEIREACKMIVNSYYKRRFGESTSSVATVTAAGVVITPQDIPSEAAKIIASFRRPH